MRARHLFLSAALILPAISSSCADEPMFFVPQDAGGDGDSDADADTDSDTDADSDADADTESETEFDCSQALIPGTLDITQIGNAIASEDLAFDGDGNVVGSDDASIFRSPYSGDPQLWVAGTNFRAGIKTLPTGDVVYCADQAGAIVRVDADDGTKTTLMTGLAYPNGLTVGQDGLVYFTEHDAGNVWQLDPYTGDHTLMASGMANPNGVTFNEDYTALYIGEFCQSGTVWKLPIDADGIPGELEAFATGVGSGCLDGIGVDICGNVYVCDYMCQGEWDDTCIWRISKDGVVEPTVFINASWHQYLPNMDWGTGIGGWDARSLYLAGGWEKHVYEVYVGVPGKPKVYP